MVRTALLFFLLVMSGCFGIRDGSEAHCDPQEPLYVALGFHVQAGGVSETVADTSFTSIYAMGTRAELRGRRINNHFYLPVPANGGEVQYVFEQGSHQEIIALEFKLQAYFRDTQCTPLLRIQAVKLVPERTSIPENKFSIRINQYHPYESTVLIAVP